MITPRMAEFLRVLDEIGKRWEREDAEKAASSQAAQQHSLEASVAQDAALR